MSVALAEAQLARSLAVIGQALADVGADAQLAHIKRLLETEMPELASRFQFKTHDGRTGLESRFRDAQAQASFLVQFLEGAHSRNQRLNSLHSNETADIYCVCRGPASDDMVACDNKNCKFEWFHLSCLKITKFPQGKWYCPACRKRMGMR